MPQILRFGLRGQPPPNPFAYATALRAVTLRWIDAVDPRAAATLHDANQPKPYTISPLWSDAGGLWFEVSVLTDWLTERLREGAATSGPEVRLGARFFTQDGAPSVEAAVSWDDLLATPAPHRPRWSLHLLTPTAHHMPSVPGDPRKSVVLPTPETYFGSWLGRWNLCGPQRLNGSLLEAVATHVAVSHCTGRTERVLLDRGRQCVGFVGDVTFEALHPATLPEGVWAALNALASLAPYCGTGVDTMRGLGQTRIKFEAL